MLNLWLIIFLVRDNIHIDSDVFLVIYFVNLRGREAIRAAVITRFRGSSQSSDRAR
jgi:hypothetical protein